MKIVPAASIFGRLGRGVTLTDRPRRSVLLAAVVLAVLLPSGCSGSSSNSLRIWYSTDDPAESRWATRLVQEFNQTHRKIRASIRTYSFDDFNTKMLVSLGAGTPPDLAYATPRTCGIPKYVQNRTLVNLTAAARRLGWARTLRPGLLQDYNSPFTIFASRRYGVAPKSVNVYAVPYAMAGVAMMYNVKLLRRLRLAVPTSVPALIQDVAVAKAAGLTPLGMGNADGFLGDDWYQTLVNTKLSYANLERELRIDPLFSYVKSGAFVWASRQLYAWRDDFTPNSGGLDAQEGVRDFFHGKTLFQLISSSENSQITSLLRQSTLKVGVFGFPGSTPADARIMPQSGYEGWVVPVKGKNHPAAVTFINWVLKPATQRFLLRQGVLPATPVAGTTNVPITGFLRQYLRALATSRPGVFLDAAPILNLNATMEANVQLLLNQPQAAEPPSVLPKALQLVYSLHGNIKNTPAQIDCEF